MKLESSRVTAPFATLLGQQLIAIPGVRLENERRAMREEESGWVSTNLLIEDDDGQGSLTMRRRERERTVKIEKT